MSQKTPAEIEAEFVAMVAGLKRVDALASMVASVRKTYFDEYVAAGFTPEQALELCKKITLE